LIAFNIDLYRIGYGSGYYDKTLEHISKISAGPKLWGIGYDFQMVDINFQDKFDIRLDKVITEKNIYV
jgi:5-formyltetrahydrofolate cyclo-ligase